MVIFLICFLIFLLLRISPYLPRHQALGATCPGPPLNPSEGSPTPRAAQADLSPCDVKAGAGTGQVLGGDRQQGQRQGEPGMGAQARDKGTGLCPTPPSPGVSRSHNHGPLSKSKEFTLAQRCYPNPILLSAFTSFHERPSASQAPGISLVSVGGCEVSFDAPAPPVHSFPPLVLACSIARKQPTPGVWGTLRLFPQLLWKCSGAFSSSPPAIWARVWEEPCQPYQERPNRCAK